MALRMVRSFRATATKAGLGALPAWLNVYVKAPLATVIHAATVRRCFNPAWRW
jgi:hypothetical protein